MKRIHLFEIEDQSWFPNWLRICLTRLIVIVHRMLGSAEALAELISKALKTTKQSTIIDLCSGSGGPMPEIAQLLQEKHGIKDLSIVLTDLYPNGEMASRINEQAELPIRYETTPVNAAAIDSDKQGLRTMVCSFHHMKPDVAHNILKNAKDQHQAICIYELSDNSIPLWISWIAFPINILQCLLITPLVRPMTWQQLVFTYLIPIIPLAFAWDGAVSNMRTYTMSDLDELLKDLQAENYSWEKGILPGRSKKLYLLGLPA